MSPHAMGIGIVAQDPADASLPHTLQAFYDSHDPVLVTVGLLEPEYDLELQIDCMESIRRQFPNAGLVIIGSGSLEEPLRNRIAVQRFRSAHTPPRRRAAPYYTPSNRAMRRLSPNDTLRW